MSLCGILFNGKTLISVVILSILTQIDWSNFSLQFQVNQNGLDFRIKLKEDLKILENDSRGETTNKRIAIVDGHGDKAAYTYMKHIREVFEMLGYEIKTGNITEKEDWDVMWYHDYTFSNEPFKSMAFKADEKKIVNHVPGSGFYTSKVSLATSGLQKGVPEAFQLPQEKTKFLKFVEANPDFLWVQKDNNHRNIQIKRVEEMDLEKKGTFVQRFVENPLLIDNRKFDTGIYTVVTSLLPLRVYIYEGDVLIRFCPKDYEPFDVKDVDKYVVGDDYTPIWEIPSLDQYFNKQKTSFKHTIDAYLGSKGLDSSVIWRQIGSIIGEVFRNQQSQMLSALQASQLKAKYFELSRFDFVVDDQLNVFLMEANMSPNLSSGHFKQNQVLYEQVLMSVMSLTGLAQHLTKETKETLLKREGSQNPLVSDRDVRIPLKICVDGGCNRCDSSLECELCGQCMTEMTADFLKSVYLEQLNRRNMRRIALDYSVSKPLTKEDRLLAAWLKAKCELDVYFLFNIGANCSLG
ncbi:unnamed protein product [Caenorhabditis auriculariae]|uniref:Uncharacterized protein n=1 Tax=Caenorhabditis auriculariae TaxID=2777116 RepID=A0A8S1HL18_9PELO|nr:unnamed protein product [Caenorhabditis auriculariae]